MKREEDEKFIEAEGSDHVPQASGAEALSDYVAAAREALVGLGFALLPGSVRGRSGFTHSFDLAGERAGRRVYVSVRRGDPLELLAEAAKAIDVDGEVVVVVAGQLDPSAPRPTAGRLRLLAASSPRELAERLRELLA